MAYATNVPGDAPALMVLEEADRYAADMSLDEVALDNAPGTLRRSD